MKTLIIVAAVVIGIVLLAYAVKLWYPHKKKGKKVAMKPTRKTADTTTEETMFEPPLIRPVISEKNKWLHPEKGSEVVERGVVR